MARNAVISISAAAGRRWRAIDPLLPAPSLPAGCGTRLVVSGAGGRAVAVGACEHWQGAPDSLELSWGAARSTGRHPAGRAAGPPRADCSTGSRESAAEKAGNALRIRRARPADIDAVACLGLEVIRFDAHFGKVIERPGSAAAMRREAARLLAGPQAWTWLAERDDMAVGMVSAERPESAGWIAPMVHAAPVAYLELMYTLPGGCPARRLPRPGGG